ncbi:MAG TPA: heat-inducible transcriptional repressor HrcA [Candidatus Limnocylindrales bacterium]|nr:heat-inducible transcriptional repressor HrcA [Candidatus Limnocylindrales bacterium]
MKEFEKSQEKPLPHLAERQRELLRAVIREYIATAEPVASAALVRLYGLDISSATVRSELAALEDMGLLTHPHTSAGRVPTDLGYRYFIENLMPHPSLLPAEQVTVSHQFQQALSNTGEWLRLATSTLARLTTEAAIVTSPANTRAALKHIEAVPINERRVLLVAVLEGGAVHQQLVELREPVSTEQLRRLSAQLTAQLGAKGAAAAREVAAERTGSADQQLVTALARLLEEHEAARSRDVYYDGIQNILAQPEFTETGSVRNIVRLLEDRTRLAEILPPLALESGEVHVAIGSEHHVEPLRAFSLIFGRYGGADDVIGYVGVVGPTRMDYARSIGAVRYVGSIMSDLVRVMEGD